MTSVIKTTNKTYFEQGDKPTASQFADFIDSCAFLAETTSQNFAGNIGITGTAVVSGALTCYSLATFNNGISVSGAVTGTITLNSPTINTPTVSAGTFASPTMTGTPVVPTAAANTNTTQAASTAFVLGQAATQAQMEAASVNTVFATPGRTQNHPGVAKAWCKFTVAAGTATLVTGYNVASVTRTANGEYSVAFTTPFSTADYGVAGVAMSDSGNMASLNTSDTNACTASTARLKTFSGSGTNITDISSVYVSFYGDQ